MISADDNPAKQEIHPTTIDNSAKNQADQAGDLKSSEAQLKSKPKKPNHSNKRDSDCLPKRNFAVQVVLCLATIGAFGAAVYYACTANQTLVEVKKQTIAANMRDRAYVYFMDPVFVPYPKKKPVVWGITIKIENVGNMPARNISIRCAHITLQKSKNIINPWPLAQWSIISMASVIGPKQGVSLQGGEIPIAIVEKAKNLEVDVSIMMEVTYIDSFEPTENRITQMSRILQFDKSGGHSLGITDTHNCTDDDCKE